MKRFLLKLYWRLMRRKFARSMRQIVALNVSFEDMMRSMEVPEEEEELFRVIYDNYPRKKP